MFVYAFQKKRNNKIRLFIIITICSPIIIFYLCILVLSYFVVPFKPLNFFFDIWRGIPRKEKDILKLLTTTSSCWDSSSMGYESSADQTRQWKVVSTLESKECNFIYCDSHQLLTKWDTLQWVCLHLILLKIIQCKAMLWGGLWFFRILCHNSVKCTVLSMLKLCCLQRKMFMPFPQWILKYSK